jgi:hypothetical protein
MAGLGMPESGVLIFVLAVVVLGVACWVIRSDAWADWVSRMLSDSLARLKQLLINETDTLSAR